jgi:Flp pilus assembly pilin Flp
MAARAALEHEAGQALSEYSVLLAVITIAAIAAFGLLPGIIITAVDSAAAHRRQLDPRG